MWSEFTNLIGRMSQKPIPVRERHLSEIPNSAVGQMSLTDRCRCRTDVAQSQYCGRANGINGEYIMSFSIFSIEKVWLGDILSFEIETLWRNMKVTYLAHYWTITWLSSRRQTVISTVLDSDCLWTALLSTAGCKSRDTNRAILLDFKWSRDIDPALWFAPGLHLSTHCL